MDKYIEYAPILVVALFFLMKNKLFVTPTQMFELIAKNNAETEMHNRQRFVSAEEMQLERKKLMSDVEQRFLSIVAFREFEKRMEDNFHTIDRRFTDSTKRFDKIDENLEHIKDILINKAG